MRNLLTTAESIRAGLSRRRWIGGAATGVALGSAFRTPLTAGEGDDDEVRNGSRFCPALPLPIPHIFSPAPPVSLHFFFPGPVEGTAVPTDPQGAHPDGRDPSTITNFDGFIGSADLRVSGTGTDLETGAESPYDFDADIRFMKGTYIGSDEQRHFGTFVFI